VDTLDLWLKKVLDFFMTKFGEIGRDAPTTVNFSSTSASMPETGVQVLSSVDPLWSHLANQPMISDHFGDLDPGFGESSFPESGPGSFEY
jgi:hypothetical protein